MASQDPTRAGGLIDFKNKILKLAGLGIEPNGTVRTAPAALIVVSAGTGAPTETVPDGSLYLRTDGSDGDDSLYMRIGSAWVALKCETA